MKVSIGKFGMLIFLNMTLDEFEDGPSKTSQRAIETLTFINFETQ